uniref:Uncharacterized protein n=1 Tax=Brassica oleracea var. oleracea TaxID=109376 RepID=A0A0D3A2T0_BRAOL
MSLTASILQLGSSLISAKVRRRRPSWRLAEKLLCDGTETASRTSRPFSSQSLSHQRETKCYLQQFVLCNKIDLLSALILLCLLISKKDSRVIKDVVFTCLISTDTLMNVAFGGVEHVSQQPPRQPDQTGILSALALPGSFPIRRRVLNILTGKIRSWLHVES